MRYDGGRNAGLRKCPEGSGHWNGGLRHCAVLGPTESEAAAVALLKSPSAESEGSHTFLLKVGITDSTVVKASYEQGTLGKTLLYTRPTPL